MKAILNVVKNIQRRISEIGIMLTELQETYNSIVPAADGMPKSSSARSRVERLAVKITHWQNEIEFLTELLTTCRDELFVWLSEQNLKNTLRTILYFRYGLLMSFEDIAEKLHLSLSYIFSLHRVALNELKTK